MSTSITQIHAINTNCVLRRNVRRQPYGRCSVCTSPLTGCHAWQASGLSFVIIVVALAAMVVGEVAARALLLVVIGLVVFQGLANHRRTDQLMATEHELRGQASRLAAAVEAATADLRAANHSLARTNLELVESNRLRETFVSGLTHDLRTPLTAISGAADNMLAEIPGSLTADQREYVEIVREHAGRLQVSIGELLQAASIEAGRVALELVAVDVRAIVDEVRHGLEPIARERRLEVRVDGPAAPLSADPAKLRRAIENLVGNALKYSPPGARVDVRVSEHGDRVEVAVADRGPGIPSEELPRLFERYYRGSGGAAGTGLGLSIARNLVRLHGGDVHVTSELGQGSEFRVVLPRDGARRRLPVVES